MLSEELKKVIKLSGGKMIVSEGDIKDSYVVMKLDQYLKEIDKETVLPSEEDEGGSAELEMEEFDLDDMDDNQIDDGEAKSDSLTNEELMDRINADIALLKQRKSEDELDDVFSDEKASQELDYDYIKN